MYRCLDKETIDCKKLAAQTGYCNFFQVEMEKFCPASCNFCGRLHALMSFSIDFVIIGYFLLSSLYMIF